MHAGGRRKGKARSRILYWFRTPPGVRVGRAALDEDAIRLIEEHNPEIEFDWTRILKGHGVETASEHDRDARQDKRRRHEPRSGVAEGRGSQSAAESGHGELSRLGAPPVGAAGIPVELEDAVPTPLDEGAATETPTEDLTAASLTHARIGFEGVSRLRARYAELMARISERVPDPARQEELKAQAERLNPDTWVTEAEVESGLENYEAVFESLRSTVGGRPHRRRRKRRRGAGQAQVPGEGDGGSGGPHDSPPDADEPPEDH